MKHRQHSSSSKTITTLLISLGVLLGIGQLALGVYLTADDNGWATAPLFSVAGLVGAVLGFYSWSSRQSWSRMKLSGVAVAIGILGSMCLMLDLSLETSGIAQAWSQVPQALVIWMLLWMIWIGAAIARLLLFKPRHTRHRLSSRHNTADH
jgi:hypothetical protein